MARPPAFRILTERVGDSIEIVLEGERDPATAPDLEAEPERIHEQGWPRRFAVMQPARTPRIVDDPTDP